MFTICIYIYTFAVRSSSPRSEPMERSSSPCRSKVLGGAINHPQVVDVLIYYWGSPHNYIYKYINIYIYIYIYILYILNIYIYIIYLLNIHMRVCVCVLIPCSTDLLSCWSPPVLLSHWPPVLLISCPKHLLSHSPPVLFISCSIDLLCAFSLQCYTIVDQSSTRWYSYTTTIP